METVDWYYTLMMGSSDEAPNSLFAATDPSLTARVIERLETADEPAGRLIAVF